jgi:hypothetical protein
VKLPRLSIAKLMVIMLVIAVDCALVRQIYISLYYRTDHETQEFFEVGGVLIMANILMVGLYRLVSRRGEQKPFLAGFEIAGFMALVAFVAWNRVLPKQVEGLITPAAQSAYQFIETYLAAPLLVSTMVGLPMLIIALMGDYYPGWSAGDRYLPLSGIITRTQGSS